MEAEAVVLALAAAQERLDLDGSVALLSEDVVYHNIPLKPVVGREAVRAYLAKWPMDSCVWEMRNIAVRGNVVLTERVDRFTSGNDRITVPVMGAFEVVDGKIAHWRDYFDMKSLTPEEQQ
jgi:limonene-1,2-epoxide hydrolase